MKSDSQYIGRQTKKNEKTDRKSKNGDSDYKH